ncbi:AtpZ/AtpI family protein [Natranaerobius thermophilus]|uniref:AtpZ/AtpI family protein n=1 Tax=Natranaerobius thermophilus TaxID=375929 RepID=UPI0003267F8D|nr:AtpZ/AtpI family protein [Natranaerobius thermophilus]
MIFIWNNIKYLAVLGQVGLVIITPVLGAFFIGSILQDRFDISGGYIIALALFGLLGGLYSAYKLLSKWWQI